MKAVIGLGNPGPKYEKTRHNIGFKVVEQAAGKDRWSTDPEKLWMAAGGPPLPRLRRTSGAEKPLFVRPLTMVNASGRCVRALLARQKVTLADILVVSDEVQLPLGVLRFGQRGSAGGHNGLQSVIDELGTEEFSRLRVGVGGKNMPDDLTDFVLGPFDREEEKVVAGVIDRAARAIRCWIDEGIESAMNRYN